LALQLSCPVRLLSQQIYKLASIFDFLPDGKKRVRMRKKCVKMRTNSCEAFSSQAFFIFIWRKKTRESKIDSKK
jgi:hypothetical protein